MKHHPDFKFNSLWFDDWSGARFTKIRKTLQTTLRSTGLSSCWEWSRIMCVFTWERTPVFLKVVINFMNDLMKHHPGWPLQWKLVSHATLNKWHRHSNSNQITYNQNNEAWEKWRKLGVFFLMNKFFNTLFRLSLYTLPSRLKVDSFMLWL